MDHFYANRASLLVDHKFFLFLGHSTPNRTSLNLNLSDFFHFLPTCSTCYRILKLIEFTSKSALAAKLDRSKVQKKTQFTLDMVTFNNLYISQFTTEFFIFTLFESLSPADSKNGETLKLANFILD